MWRIWFRTGNPQIHKQRNRYYWFCKGHTGLYAPRLPTIRPQDAEERRQIRPEIAAQNRVFQQVSGRRDGAPLECRTSVSAAPSWRPSKHAEQPVIAPRMPTKLHAISDLSCTAPCPPGTTERWLQVRLGCIQLSSSCPFRLLHTFLSPGRRGVTPAFGYGAPHLNAGGT